MTASINRKTEARKHANAEGSLDGGDCVDTPYAERIRAEFVEEFGRMNFDLISNLEQAQAEICAGMNRAPAGRTCLLTQFFQSWLPTAAQAENCTKR
jgi:hypothetical protein